MNGYKEFTVHGPFVVPVEKRKNGRMVSISKLKVFWEETGELRDRKGIYVFCVRAGKGITPVYVGKTGKRSFEYEAFADHKLANHYNPALLDGQGTPVLFLIAHPKSKGAVNKRLIDQLETFFIDVAYQKNPDLSNIRKKPEYNTSGASAVWCARSRARRRMAQPQPFVEQWASGERLTLMC